MKCDPTTKRYTIAVPEDNSFALILPLKQRTYVSNMPIDTPIVYAELEDVVLTVGGVEYATTQELDGVHVEFPVGLKRGIYDIILKATYRGAQIRAAYFEALKAVQWQYLSSFEQYTVGSPVVADAAFVIGGPLTDAELEALKAEYRDKIAEAEAAKEAAEQAKEDWEQKAAELDGVAQETTAEAAKTAATQAAQDAAQAKSAAVDAKSAAEALAPVAQAAEAYNEGKPALAQAITDKGVATQDTASLAQMAENVGLIQQQTTILDGGDVYAQQLFGDADPTSSELWNLYDVLAQMKSRFMGGGDYAALIVCEYYKGYDSLQLQGADGYYTCDGDYYDYASPTHIWHDADNGKANRWVAFLYRQAGARLDITNTAISPRSMYIGGHIGTIEYFVDGRLTELVSGVEETDVVDNFLQKNFAQAWNRNVVMRGVTDISTQVNIPIDGVLVLDAEKINYSGTNHTTFTTTASAVYWPKCKEYGIITRNCILYALNAVIFYAPLLESIRSSDVIFQYSGVGAYKLQLVYMPSLKYQAAKGKLFSSSAVYGMPQDCIDLWVGAMETKLDCSGWNPTNVLADATKKARLIDNIKNHILARVSDATGGTQLVFTVSTNMYNAIASENIEWQGQTMTLADAFLTKNWLLAGA